MGKQKKVIATRVTDLYAQALEEFARKDDYINCADLLRDALREKLQRLLRTCAGRFWRGNRS